MKNLWKTGELDALVPELGCDRDLAACIYASRLIGSDRSLVLHGGGNTSVKTITRDILGDPVDTLFVKGSGIDLASIGPEGFAPVDLARSLKLRSLKAMSDEEMTRQLRLLLLDQASPHPSIEAFLHAFLPAKFILHTHPDAILALTNQRNPEEAARKVIGKEVPAVSYVRAGYDLAQAAVRAFERHPEGKGMLLLKHGLVTWGDTAEQAYSATIELVTVAERYWESGGTRRVAAAEAQAAQARYLSIAPMLRGSLAESTGDADIPYRRFVLLPLMTPEILDFIATPEGRKLACSPPLTPDHLIRTKHAALLVEDPAYDDAGKLREQIRSAIAGYVARYNEYFDRHAARLSPGARRFDPLPRVIVLPGLGVVCAGPDAEAATIARDITEQSLLAKRRLAARGIDYCGIEEEHLFDMEYFLLQQAKLKTGEKPLGRQIAVVTGAVGAIGSGITEKLLENGCHVAITDLPGEPLKNAEESLRGRFPGQVFATPMNVTDPSSVHDGFQQVVGHWGGVDLVIVNAGIAMVSSLLEMDLEAFRRVERVNTEGTLLVLREAAGIFQQQKTGGDIVLISTKNVFAPGARFGAYSATKAAAHQLARIASLEFAESDVRVNMVAPDAVFSHGATKSGLWAEVGPDRMRARGLDEAGLEEYYRSRNLLKAKVTAEHVARAVLFFATRQTPTTGATIPVDGGLPDSTPR